MTSELVITVIITEIKGAKETQSSSPGQSEAIQSSGGGRKDSKGDPR